MKRTLCLLVLPVVAGCLSSAPKAPVNWIVEWVRPESVKPIGSVTEKRSVRIASVSVRAPYDGTRFAVLRADGSVAFDAYNVFAARPSSLLKGAAEDVVEASGLYSQVIGTGSLASSYYTDEISVTKLALDATANDRLEAVVELSIVQMRGHEIVASAKGSGRARVEKDFSAAFSKAFAEAMDRALRGL